MMASASPVARKSSGNKDDSRDRLPRRSPTGLLTKGLPVSLAVLSAALSACSVGDLSLDESLQMVDCDFAAKGPIHLHLSESRGTASVLTDYQPAHPGSHKDALRDAKESKGRLLAAAGSRHRVDVFLRQADFGIPSDDSLRMVINQDGSAHLEAQAPGSDAIRVIDTGRCVYLGPQG